MILIMVNGNGNGNGSGNDNNDDNNNNQACTNSSQRRDEWAPNFKNISMFHIKRGCEI